MPLESVSTLLAKADREKYAVGYFESWNFESLNGVIDAAEETRSPVVIGFNGEFLSHDERTLPERLNWYAALGREAAESARVPCAFIFNECGQDDWLRRAVTAGFNIIMPSNEKCPDLKKYEAWVASLTALAHGHGVAVEAELGVLPYGDPDAKGEYTDPEAAEKFVGATKVDLLAVSIGNVHVMGHGRQGLNLDHLARIRERVRIPLVLHGGTGIADESLKEAVRLGITKVNFGTNLKRGYMKAVHEALHVDQMDPHRLLGWGGEQDVMVAGRKAIRDLVAEKMAILGCMGKA